MSSRTNREISALLPDLAGYLRNGGSAARNYMFERTKRQLPSRKERMVEDRERRSERSRVNMALEDAERAEDIKNIHTVIPDAKRSAYQQTIRAMQKAVRN